MSKYSTITAKRLIRAMDKTQIRPNELAQKSGVNKSSISQYMNGHFTPTSTTAKKLSAVLGVSADWLMGLEPEESLEVNGEKFKLLASDKREYLLGSLRNNAESLDDYFLEKLIDYSIKLCNMQNDL